MYWSFKLGNKNIVINKNLAIPTLINKYNQSEKEHPYIDGFINYKNTMYTILDLSNLYGGKKIKKIDGLMLLNINENHIAIKYEGFCDEVDKKNGSIELLPSDLLKLFI